MTFQYLTDPSGQPSWKGVLPGSEEAYFLRKGDGERAVVAGDLFTVLLSGDETGGQFGAFTCAGRPGDPIPTHSHADTNETFYIVEGKVRLWVQKRDGSKVSEVLSAGDFGYVPSGLAHTYQITESALIFGVSTGGFERFFQEAGQPTDHKNVDQPPYFDMGRMIAASKAHGNRVMPDFNWED